ncbi:hypothetical protein PoB_004630600 [Plakobranchus ocellatus]|uniref:Galectin n=1 Tax=Plakobranchus ocellatus TaxID=259542 RepID=A0AAV4BLC8_9GAST|nr:hypothetical protein PoB_004630600 [Plakobranchus ocellatus]
MVQKLYPRDKEAHFQFYHIVQEPMENGPDLLSKIIFRDEATLHLSGKMNRHNVRIWGTQNPHAILEFERTSHKVNVFYAVTERAVYGPFFFHEALSITGSTVALMIAGEKEEEEEEEDGEEEEEEDGEEEVEEDEYLEK